MFESMIFEMSSGQKLKIGFASLVLGAIGMGLYVALHVLGLIIWGAAAAFTLVAVQVETSCRMRRQLSELYADHSARLSREMANHYKQTEALFSLFSIVHPRAPLPAMRDWAISPDFADLLVDTLQQRRPKLILELGSGISTVITAYMLERLGGHLISIDHDAKYLRKTQHELEKHGLERFVTLVHAPLSEIAVEGQWYKWYDLSALSSHEPIDVLVVDGPPGSTGKLARYPALPVLWDQMAARFTILLDDTMRADEARIIELWRQRYPELQSQSLDFEEGAVVLERVPFSMTDSTVKTVSSLPQRSSEHLAASGQTACTRVRIL